MHGHRRRHREERGAAAVEFALVMPILIVVVLGIVNLGFVLAQQISLNNGARQAARFAVVEGPTCGQIELEGKNSAETIGMEATDVPAPVLTRAAAGAPTPHPPAPCPAPCDGSTVGDSITVTMTRTAGWVVPFPPFTSGNAPTLVGTGVMRCEFS
jgi:Flp pilus assembly pilin Flp